MYKKHIIYSFLIILLLGVLPTSLSAETVKPKSNTSSERKAFIYDKPSYRKLSQLYWALSKFDPTVDYTIDNFMRINECDVFQDYYYDELEWENVRNSSRKYITSSAEEFSTRFEIVQPLHFSEYDLKQEAFEIWKPYRIENKKLFEVLSPEHLEDVCGIAAGRNIEGYPRGLIMEFPRPFSLIRVKMEPDIARAYINSKKGKTNTSSTARRKSHVYSERTAYLVMYVKFFALRDDEYTTGKSLRARALATIEEVRIYADDKRRFLLYSRVFAQREETATAEKLFRKRQERRKRKREEGL